MKKRWNIRRLIPASLLVTLFLTCGAVFAYMFSQASVQGVQFIPAQVSCVVAKTSTPSQVSEVTVRNTGNIPAYLRVRLVTYWVDTSNNIAAKTPPTLTVSYDSANWVAGADNTFYYKTPVAKDVVTGNLLLPETPLPLLSDGEYKQVIDIFGEAIQANPTTAVTGGWGATLSDTTITAGP